MQQNKKNIIKFYETQFTQFPNKLFTFLGKGKGKVSEGAFVLYLQMLRNTHRASSDKENWVSLEDYALERDRSRRSLELQRKELVDAGLLTKLRDGKYRLNCFVYGKKSILQAPEASARADI